MESKSKVQYVQPSCSNSFSTCVNTAAYILSNTTNNAETMANTEGAKHNAIASSQNTRNMKMTQIVPDKMYGMNNENIGLGNTCEAYTLNGSQDRNFMINKNLLNITLSHLKQNYLAKENFMSQDSVEKIGHWKKLYTGRNSPVDLTNMKSSNKCKIYKMKQNLHPALDFGYKLPKKYKMYAKRRTMHVSVFNKSLMDNSQCSIRSFNKHYMKKSRLNFNGTSRGTIDLTKNDTLSVNNNTMDNSMIDQHSVECDTNQHLITSLPIKKSINTKNKLNKRTNRLKKVNTKKYKEPNNVIKESTNLNPAVYLMRLSKDDIEKYTKSKKIRKNLNNLNIIQLSKLDNKEHKEQNKLMTSFENVDSIVRSTRLSILSIQKHKKLGNRIIDLNPVVCLKRLSEFEIQKYNKFAHITANIGSLNPKKRLIKRRQELNGKIVNKVQMRTRTRKRQDNEYPCIKNSSLSSDKSKIICKSNCSNNTVYTYKTRKKSHI